MKPPAPGIKPGTVRDGLPIKPQEPRACTRRRDRRRHGAGMRARARRRRRCADCRPFASMGAKLKPTIPLAPGQPRSGSALSHWSAQQVGCGREAASARSQTGHRSGWPRNHAAGTPCTYTAPRRPSPAFAPHGERVAPQRLPAAISTTLRNPTTAAGRYARPGGPTGGLGSEALGKRSREHNRGTTVVQAYAGLPAGAH